MKTNTRRPQVRKECKHPWRKGTCYTCPFNPVNINAGNKPSVPVVIQSRKEVMRQVPFYDMLRQQTGPRVQTRPDRPAFQTKAPKATSGTALAKRRPDIVVRDTLAIEPVDLNTEIPAVDSSLLLQYICRVLTDYAHFKRAEDVITIALWIASTWFVKPTAEQGMKNGHLMFGAHPRLWLIGEPSSGKNRVLKIIKELVRNPTAIGSGVVTSYGVRNAIESGRTVIIDEYHKRVGSTGKKQSDLQEIVLAYSDEEGSIDGQGGHYNEHVIFGPMVLAGQPEMQEGIVGAELRDQFQRGFIVYMEEWTDPDQPIRELDEGFYGKCKDLHDALELFAAGVYETMGHGVRKYTPIHTVPKALTSRMREISLPLLFVADVSVNPDTVREKGRDTEWAEMARNAVQVVLLGHGDNASVLMGSLAARFGDAE